MAINLDAVRNKLNSLQQKVQKSDNLWKPEPGKQIVRIVPYKHNQSFPFIELYFHYGLGKTILSPRTYGEKDPIAELAESLKRTGNKEDYQLSKTLEPKMRTYVPVLVRGKENEGVKFWGFGKNVYSELLGYFDDPDYGDLTDPRAGRDIQIEFKTAQEVGKNFPETYIRVKPNATLITEDSSVLEMLKDQPDLTTLFKRYEYGELETMLKNWLETGNVDGAQSEDDASSPTSNASQAGSSNIDDDDFDTSVTSKKADIKEAFDDMFND